MNDIDIDIDAIRARAEAATEGPWEVYTTRDDHMNTVGPRRQPTEYDSSDHVNLADASQGGEGGIWADADAEFIAHAREDVPALLAEVERLRDDRDEQGRYLSVVAEFARTTGMSPAEVMAVGAKADADRLAAEVENLRDDRDRWKQAYEMADPLLTDRDRLAATVARVEALADEHPDDFGGWIAPSDLHAALKGDS